MFNQRIFQKNKAPQKPRKPVRCKGIIPGTNIKCGATLCETDGALLFIASFRL
jgi:hypothetical protein